MTDAGSVQTSVMIAAPEITALERAVRASFIGEIEAFKPGNVSFAAAGHKMTAIDFIKSADVSVPILCSPGLGVGRRVLDSVKATRAVVGCNTNLGMLLLFSPLICAAQAAYKNAAELRRNLEITLGSLTNSDTEQIYAAIRLADPGGLGDVEQGDVRLAPTTTLIEAMNMASPYDLIAMQYCNHFDEVFGLGLNNIKCFVKRWNSVKWATVACYMSYLAAMPDSHIGRKFGADIAEQIKIKSGGVAKTFTRSPDPKACIGLLKELDDELKNNNYNPGACADLTAASLLVYNLTRD